MRFADALAQPGLRAIAEVKRRSPSAGDLRVDADPGVLAAAFARAGAAAVSVLVDERFGGSVDDLRAARAATDTPLLGKGFFSTEPQLDELRDAGADAALLILRDLDDATTARLLAHARSLGMDALVEAHTDDELQRALALDAPVVGVNARDLDTFAIDRVRQLELVLRAAGGDRIVIAESGVHTRAQGAAAELAGADAILVGSALMRAPDPAAKLHELLSRPLVKVCGLTRQEDVDAAVEAGADLLGFILVAEEPSTRGDRARRAGRRALGGGLRRGDHGDDRRPRAVLSRRRGHRPRARGSAPPGGTRGRQGARSAVEGPATRVTEARSLCGRWTHRARRRARGRRTCATAIAAVRPWAVDAASSLERSPRREGSPEGARLRAGGTRVTDGLRHVRRGDTFPETLMPALDELERAWREALTDAAFHAELHPSRPPTPAGRRR